MREVALVGLSPWFAGSRAALARALRARGALVEEREGVPPRPRGTVVVLGPHDHALPSCYTNSGAKVGLFSEGAAPLSFVAIWTEQPGSAAQKLRASYRSAYDGWLEIDADLAKKENVPWYQGWSDFEAVGVDFSAARPIDVLWYGTMTERRREILSSLAESLPFEISMPSEPLWGEAKRAALLSAKIVLGIRAYEEPSFHSFRAADAAACGALFMAERPLLAEEVRHAVENWPDMERRRRFAFEAESARGPKASAAVLIEEVERVEAGARA